MPYILHTKNSLGRQCSLCIQLLCSCVKFKVIHQLAPPLAIAIAKQHPCKLHRICTKTTTKVLYTGYNAIDPTKLNPENR